jgi:tyrosine-specific transport protein
MMFGLTVTFVLMLGFLMPNVKGESLMRTDWNALPLAVSVVSTSFGFQIIIPTLTQYFKRDVGQLKKAILIGSILALVIYILWEFVTLGIIPLEGKWGIVEGGQRGDHGANLVAGVLQNPLISLIAAFFSFFALITSFLGVSISLTDFLADGLKIRKSPKGRGILFLLTFLPPLFFVLTDPRAFLTALEYAGAFGVVVLLGFLPALMVYSGRYRLGLKSEYQAPGGKTALIVVILFSILVIGNELWIKLS